MFVNHIIVGHTDINVWCRPYATPNPFHLWLHLNNMFKSGSADCGFEDISLHTCRSVNRVGHLKTKFMIINIIIVVRRIPTYVSAPSGQFQFGLTFCHGLLECIVCFSTFMTKLRWAITKYLGSGGIYFCLLVSDISEIMYKRKKNALTVEKSNLHILLNKYATSVNTRKCWTFHQVCENKIPLHVDELHSETHITHVILWIYCHVFNYYCFSARMWHKVFQWR